MKRLYKKCNEDLKELCKIFEADPEIRIAEPHGEFINTPTNSYAVQKAWIGGEETYFTTKLVKFLKEKEIIATV
ncbi:MAG: hypothetical protein LUD19_01180 [Clostridia bacterium]|nr:hypothetical protein [Clostridia bacterium]